MEQIMEEYDIDYSKSVKYCQRKIKRVVPESEKDDRYWEKRKRNNIAAKRSRENKRFTETNIRQRTALLEEENILLRRELACIKAKFGIPIDHSFLSEEDTQKRIGNFQMSHNKFIPQSREDPREMKMTPVNCVTNVASPMSSPEQDVIMAEVSDSGDMDRSATPELHCNVPHKKLCMKSVRTADSFQQQTDADYLLQQRTVADYTRQQTFFYGSPYGPQFMWAPRCSTPIARDISPMYNHEASSLNTVSKTALPCPGTQVSMTPHTQNYFVYKNPMHEDKPTEQPTDLSSNREKYATSIKQEHTHSSQHSCSDDSGFKDDSSEMSYAREVHNEEYISNHKDRLHLKRWGHVNSPNLTARSHTTCGRTDWWNDEPGSADDSPVNNASHIHPDSYHEHGHPDNHHEHRNPDTHQEHRNPDNHQDHRHLENHHEHRHPDNSQEHRHPDTHHEHRPDIKEQQREQSGYRRQEEQQEEPFLNDNDQLRKENEDLKVGIRHLFSQVFKMKDIVLQK